MRNKLFFLIKEMLTLIVVSLFVVAISAQRDHRSIGLTRAFLEDGKPRQIENRWEKVGKPNPETPVIDFLIRFYYYYYFVNNLCICVCVF